MEGKGDLKSHGIGRIEGVGGDGEGEEADARLKARREVFPIFEVLEGRGIEFLEQEERGFMAITKRSKRSDEAVVFHRAFV